MAHIIERVCAKDLALTTVAHQSFEESVERLYLSLLKTNAVVLDLGEDGWDDKIQTCLADILPDGPLEGPARRGMRGRPAIARLVKEFRLGQRGRQDWCEQEDLQHVCPYHCLPRSLLAADGAVDIIPSYQRHHLSLVDMHITSTSLTCPFLHVDLQRHDQIPMSGDKHLELGLCELKLHVRAVHGRRQHRRWRCMRGGC